MDIPKAAALVWCTLCCCWDFLSVLEAATLGSRQNSSPRDGPGSSSSLGRKHERTFKRHRAGTVVPHEYMLSLYSSLSESERKGLNSSLVRARTRANMVTSFADQGTDGTSVGKKQRYLFDISNLPSTGELVGGELRIFSKFPANLQAALSRGGSLYRILLQACPGRGSRPAKRLDSRTVDILDAGSSRWQVFDVWDLLKSHVPASPLCLEVEIVSGDSQEVLDPRLWGFNRSDLQPQEKALLVAFSNTRRKENLFREIRDRIKSLGGGAGSPPAGRHGANATRGRRRRRRTAFASRASRGSGKRARSRCSRKPLHVNFKELGWDDWIIAPLDYEAYHCEGLCDFPLRSHLEPTNHAIIQTLMNSMDPEATPPSCCVPAKLSPISILYIDSGNNVVYKQYEDMVVESCGCR
ncbi:growth/differentiation factor 6-A [Cetorhinus maximus]